MPCVLVQVGGNNFVDEEFRRRKRTGRFVFLSNVTRERFFSCASVVLATSRADFNLSVSDDPHMMARGLSSLEIKPWGFSLLWHTRQDSNISAIALSDTKNLPATSVTRKRPFLISVRNDGTVMCPPGKKRSIASCSV